MALIKNVVATYEGLKLRGKIVGENPTHFVVDVTAADLGVLKGIGYPHPCIIVPRNAVKAR